jgi:hypothetical protein
MNLFIYKNNCKSSKQVLDILELRRENNIRMICIDDLPKHKALLITEKYKVRDTPCIITSNKILYSSEMFSFVKNGSEQKVQTEKKDGFFTGFNILDSGSGVFSQSFCAINDEEIDAQQYFCNVEGISGPSVEVEKPSQKNKKSKSKKASEVDRKYEEIMEERNTENKTKDKRFHNDIPDFSKPFNKI